MEKKLSAYQNLKAENLKLKQDIYKLVMLEDSENVNDVMDYTATKITWTMRFELENIFWGRSRYEN